MNTTTCSCGGDSCGPNAHVMARRLTADGIMVQVWSDGAVTCGLGTYIIRGVRSGRNAFALGAAVEAAWLVAGEVSLYDHAELRGLCVAARQAVGQPSLRPLEYLRAVMSGVKFATIKRGAVVRHAAGCPCTKCSAARARSLAAPAAGRVYLEIALSNGGASFVRVR